MLHHSTGVNYGSTSATTASRTSQPTAGTSETAPCASIAAQASGGGSVAVVAAAIAADRRRPDRRRRRQQLGGRNLPSLPVLPPRSRGPIRAPEPPPPYWAHYAHRPVPAQPAASCPTAERIGSAASSAAGRGGAGAASGRHNTATTTDDSDTSNDRPRAHRGRSTSGDSSSTGAGGQAARGPERAEPAVRHRYNVPNPQQRQRIKEHLLSQDAFCPDLVRNCKNIATDSPERQSSPAPVEYAEIGELSRNLAAVVAINDGASTSTGRTRDGPASNATIDELPGTPVSQPNGQASNGISPNGHNHHHHHVIVRKKSRTRSKERLFSEKYVSDNNLSEYHSEKLRSVAHANEYTIAPTTVVSGAGSNLYRKSNRKNSERLKKKDRLLLYSNGTTVDASVHHNNNNQHAVNLNKDPAYGESLKEKMAVALKNTYSEPSLYTTVSEPSASTKHRHHSRHHHRRRRERYRSQRFGYEIHNVDEFLSKCSLSSPGNIPVVLSSAATLYQTRPGSYQIEIPLPLGMVVNAVFKNQNWLYVQTPHAEEGYVAYDTCLPLGILPSNQRSSSSSKPTPCWESNKDVFPKPCGNLTDSEKEIQQLRGGTRSEGRRTPRLKRSSANSRSAVSITTCNSERDLDSLYLRTVASNQPKVADGQTQYAQLKLTTKVLNTVAPSVKSEKALAIEQLEKLICSGSGDYVHLLKQQQQHLLAKQQQYIAQLRQQQQLCIADSPTIGKHLSNVPGTKVINGSNHLRIALSGITNNGPASVNGNGSVNVCSPGAAVRQTLLAITENYCSDAVSVHKGDVVTLLACKEYQEKGLKNYKQWFFVRTRDGHEGYIPAEAAGHGFL
uniref:SH3 domain-containing protein n=1 Tax=Anopheles maculatus TaxID=74869 RepID=A0A182T3K9_9DIPT